jgi:hypothetical protein
MAGSPRSSRRAAANGSAWLIKTVLNPPLRQNRFSRGAGCSLPPQRVGQRA